CRGSGVGPVCSRTATVRCPAVAPATSAAAAVRALAIAHHGPATTAVTASAVSTRTVAVCARRARTALSSSANTRVAYGSIHVQAERMAGRVEEHADVVLGLKFRHLRAGLFCLF